MKKLLVIFFCFCLFVPAILTAKQKVIFNSDLGDDIDDAFALALILSSPEFDVIGIVMDYGYTSKRAQIACRMLYETGLEHIPVAVGRETNQKYSSQFKWGEGFTKVKPIKQSATDFIIENLRKYPNKIIIITVGPATNMGDVIKKDPNALKLAKRIYCMAGSFYMGYNGGPVPDAEWNVDRDVESSKLFFASGARITCAGLDITTFVKLDNENLLKLLMRQSPLTNALCGLYSLWGHETPTLYDVVSVGMILWPDIFATRPAHVRVIGNGYTIIDESKSPNCKIGTRINKDEFLDRIMKRYLGQNLGRN